MCIKAADIQTFLVRCAVDVVQSNEMSVSYVEREVVRAEILPVFYDCSFFRVVCYAMVVISDGLEDRKAVKTLQFFLILQESEVVWNPELVVYHVTEGYSVEHLALMFGYVFVYVVGETRELCKVIVSSRKMNISEYQKVESCLVTGCRELEIMPFRSRCTLLGVFVELW